MTSSLPRITIYTDGGCDPNPGPGGWAVVILSPEGTREFSGADPETTNNRMELTAAIQSLNSVHTPSEIMLFTDSQYLKRGIEEWMPRWLAKNWRGKSGPVANQDLWKALLAAAKPHTITWHWLRGHTGDTHNSRADWLVRQARRKLKNGS